MRTLYRANSSGRGAFLVGGLVCAWWLAGVCAAPFYGSLYTPAREGQAIGPLPGEPPAYYPYEPREIKNLSELPAEVRSKVVAHVKERVGAEFFGRLAFEGGQFVDVGELHRVNPASRRLRDEVPAHLLHFGFKLPKVGIRHYAASVALRGDGSVLRELDLPPVAKHPEKAAFKPLSEVCVTLTRQGRIDPGKATATITYDARGERFLWHFEQALPGDGPEIKVRTVEVDAHTGEMLRQP